MNLKTLRKILEYEPLYRLKQTYQAVFKNCVESWDEATNLPKDLREKLKQECPLDIKAAIYNSEGGGTTKAVLTLRDGAVVEAVLMRQPDGRNTICLSSEVGCQLGCAFCATGRIGYKRGLASDEIIEQALLFARLMRKKNERLDNVVFMGMGEPFLNYNEVMKAIYALNNKEMFGIGARKISISTAGIPEGILNLAKEPIQVNLAVSLHAPDDKLRSELMPVNKKYPSRTVLRAVSQYIEKTGRRVMIEYVLLKDINDSPEMARKLANLLRQELRGLFFVNLIPYNSAGRFQPPEGKKIKQFREVLEKSGLTVTQRFRSGRDIKGACGQLAGDSR